MQVSTASKRHRLIFLVLALVVFGLDQATKWPILTQWQLGQSKPVLPFLALTYVKNTGSLFGMFQGNAFVLGLISLTITIGIIVYAWRLTESQGLAYYIALGILLGGAMGNMLDRLRLGFVVDFFDLQWGGRNIWPVFNVADIAINVAIGLLLLLTLLESFADSRSKPETSSAES